MPKDERFATLEGAMLADPPSLGNLLESAGEAVFEPAFWSARGELGAATTGRGATWFIESGTHAWVLRHYRRGGLAARVSQDRYLWLGETRVRAFAEYRLLSALTKHGLPVPRPVAARYRRTGVSYRCDLLMQRLEDTRTLSAMLAAAALPDDTWRAVGAVIARLHRAGVDHADLNAHNVLIDGRGIVSIVDLDRGRMRAGGGWTAANLARLHRSLTKIAPRWPPGRFSNQAWDALLAGYAAEPGAEPSAL